MAPRGLRRTSQHYGTERFKEGFHYPKIAEPFGQLSYFFQPRTHTKKDTFLCWTYAKRHFSLLNLCKKTFFFAKLMQKYIFLCYSKKNGGHFLCWNNERNSRKNSEGSSNLNVLMHVMYKIYMHWCNKKT